MDTTQVQNRNKNIIFSIQHRQTWVVIFWLVPPLRCQIGVLAAASSLGAGSGFPEQSPVVVPWRARHRGKTVRLPVVPPPMDP